MPKLKEDDRVVRGPSWKWGNQDGGEGSVGTVCKVKDNGWVEVKWDESSVKNSYRMGEDGAQDLELVCQMPSLPLQLCVRRNSVALFLSCLAFFFLFVLCIA